MENIKRYLIVAFLFIAIPSWTQGLPDSVMNYPGTYYVMAPSGLKLRSTADPASKPMATMPFGAKVELTKEIIVANMTVDQLKGGMAQIKYNNAQGYAFDGYLSQFPPIKARENYEVYIDRVRLLGHSLAYETVYRDLDGYLVDEISIEFPTRDWSEAFILAQSIFKLPRSLSFPAEGNALEETIENPEKEKEVKVLDLAEFIATDQGL